MHRFDQRLTIHSFWSHNTSGEKFVKPNQPTNQKIEIFQIFMIYPNYYFIKNIHLHQKILTFPDFTIDLP